MTIRPPFFVKDPSAMLDYQMDWTAWLNGSDQIATSTWDVPAGLTKGAETHNGLVATVIIAGGTAGSDYPVTNSIVTTGGRADSRTVVLRVRDR
jgi:hypothetical protein